MEKAHPILKFNYPARVSGNLVCLFMSCYILGEQLAQLPWLFLPLFSLIWPHVARFISPMYWPSKKAELINLHVDAVFFAIYSMMIPAVMVITALIAATAANSLVTAGPGLLASCMAVYGVALLVLFPMFQPDGFMPLDMTAQVATAITIVFYFCVFASFAYMMARRLVKTKKEIEELSQRDGLTKLYNRRFLDNYMPRELMRAQRMSYSLSVVFADLDHFKQINDHHGHLTGDAVLQGFAEILSQDLREELDWVARYGGEEFVLILPGCDADTASKVAERLRQRVESKSFAKALSVSCSFGGGQLPP